MKKVVILTAADPYKDIRAIKIAISLEKKGYLVTVVGGKTCESPKNQYQFNIVSFHEEYQSNQSVYKKVLKKIRFIFWICKTVRKINPNIIHACNVDMLMAAFCCKKQGTNVIYDSFEICSSKEGAVSQSPLVKHIVMRVEKCLIPKCSGMICVSNAAKQWFEQNYICRPEIQVITNVPMRTGILDDCNFSHIERRPKHITYIGMYGKNRGIEELIESGQFLDPKNVKIDIRGFGALKMDLQRLSKKKQVTNIVEFLDPVATNEILDTLMKTADIGVVLTKPTSLNHELTVSNKIFDYINAGLPVIMSRVSEHIYLNQQYHFGIVVDIVDAQHIADAINLICSDSNLYDELSKNARKAAQTLNWEVEVKKLYSIYDKL